MSAKPLDAYNRRDLDAMLAHWAPDAVVDARSNPFPTVPMRRVIAADGGDQGVHGPPEGTWDEVRITNDNFIIFGEPAIEVEDGPSDRGEVTPSGQARIEVQARSAWLDHDS